jgi:CRISPR-associated protein Cas1
MSTLVLDRSDLELRADGAALALYERGERKGTVPFKLLDRVVVQGKLALDTSVLTGLADQGIAMVLLSRRQSRRVAYVLGAGHSDAAIRLAQCQFASDQRWCDEWARRLVLRKLRGQIKLLQAGLAARADRRKPLIDAQRSVEEAAHTLAAGHGLPASTVRGLEGAAAAAYFRGLAALFADALGFCGRNRRPPRDPVNAALSLGYTLLHFEAVATGHGAGLDVMIGFFHRPAFGRESLACDLIEPLRPRLDAWVWQLFQERVLREEHFAHDKGACLLHKAGRAHFYQAYEVFAAPVRRLLRRECNALARGLRRRGAAQLVAAGSDEDF